MDPGSSTATGAENGSTAPTSTGSDAVGLACTPCPLDFNGPDQPDETPQRWTATSAPPVNAHRPQNPSEPDGSSAVTVAGSSLERLERLGNTIGKRRRKACPRTQNSAPAGTSETHSRRCPVEEVIGHAAGIGWEAAKDLQVERQMDRLPLVGLGVAGNAGRFGGAALLYDEHTGQYSFKIHHGYTTQEESVISNMVAAGTNFLDENGQIPSDCAWGLIEPQGHSCRTHQQIDYTKPGLSPQRKYGKAVSVRGMAFYQAAGHRWDKSRKYDAVAVITAGPNNGARGRGRSSSMRRTLDTEAADWDYFTDAIVSALTAMFDEMARVGVEVAIVPGLSTGLYSGKHRAAVNAPGVFYNLIERALIGGGRNRAELFARIIYAHY